MVNLKLLGLNAWQSAAYQSLVRLGKASAMEISQDSRVPYGRIYDVINSLVEMQLVKVIPEKFKKFIPGDPEKLKEILTKKQKELSKLSDQIDELKLTYIEEKEPVIVIKGKRNFYKALQYGRNGEGRNPLFYVSSSPWNMYDLFREFFQINDIPVGPIFLRDWGFERQTVFAIKNHKYKLDSICYILDSFPDLKFILIGDSGEEDPEIYTQVIDSYPQRILTAYIRCVKRDPQRRDEIHSLAELVKKSGSALVLIEDTHVMEKHAAQRGWISLSSAPQPAE